MTNKGLGLPILLILPEQAYKIDENKLKSGLEHLGELQSDPNEGFFLGIFLDLKFKVLFETSNDGIAENGSFKWF